MLEKARVARAKREHERAESEALEERQRAKQLHFMKCPKCGHDLAQCDLEGVNVDQCSFCEGVFLDAGELDFVVSEARLRAQGSFPKAAEVLTGDVRRSAAARETTGSRTGLSNSRLVPASTDTALASIPALPLPAHCHSPATAAPLFTAATATPPLEGVAWQ